ncbi:MAG: DUF3500 domain-containing protein [Planctomycetes bacterium]|nr:DUF3500 domain-containing protein [Planctomycetota bacterium]
MRSLPRSTWLVLAVALLLPACAARRRGRASEEPTRGVVADIAGAAQAFLAALPAEQRALAMRPLADPERTSWAFVPGRYAGLELGAMDDAARVRALALLQELLSEGGYAKTTSIIALEAHLREIEGVGGRDVSHRDPGRYAVLVYGEPSERGAFSLRFQGHHVSLHWSFCDGMLAGGTPHFLGSNPHEVRSGAAKGQRVLGAEEDRARELLASLSGRQLERAVIDAEAPNDVVLVPGIGLDALGAPRGLAVSEMSLSQRALLRALVELGALNLRGELAEAELARLEPEMGSLHFAWAGSSVRGRAHYWRVQGPTFAIEYDNTQNDANHVHFLWRDRARDFGGDPLREHLRDHAEAHAHDAAR